MIYGIVFRLSVAIMPRDSMPESKAAIMSRLRDMNQQLAAIDKMSNNMEREFKNTRLVGILLFCKLTVLTGLYKH